MNDTITYFSVLEQHYDGAWWHHPRWSFDNFDKAAAFAVDFSARYKSRPVVVIEHTGEILSQSCCIQLPSHGVATFYFFAGWLFAKVNIINTFKPKTL